MAYYDDDEMSDYEHYEMYGDRCATPQEAMNEWAWNVGSYDRFKDSEWLLHDNDVWLRNPHYSGPPQRHPEADPEDTVVVPFPVKNNDYICCEDEDGIPF